MGDTTYCCKAKLPTCQFNYYGASQAGMHCTLVIDICMGLSPFLSLCPYRPVPIALSLSPCPYWCPSVSLPVPVSHPSPCLSPHPSPCPFVTVLYPCHSVPVLPSLSLCSCPSIPVPLFVSLFPFPYFCPCVSVHVSLFLFLSHYPCPSVSVIFCVPLYLSLAPVTIAV